MAFPLRPDDHVGTELFEIHTEEYAFGFTGMIVSFAISLVVEGENLVIPADINRPETDLISIKKQEEESSSFDIRRCNTVGGYPEGYPGGIPRMFWGVYPG